MGPKTIENQQINHQKDKRKRIQRQKTFETEIMSSMLIVESNDQPKCLNSISSKFSVPQYVKCNQLTTKI